MRPRKNPAASLRLESAPRLRDPGKLPAPIAAYRAAPGPSSHRKLNPVPSPVPRVEIPHGVVQSPDGPHHRHGAVTQAVHLVQAAWLEPRRHQEQIRASLDQVRQRLIEADLRGHPIRMPRRQSEPQIFVSPFAVAEQHKRRVEPRQLVGNLGNQIKALSDRPAARSARRAGFPSAAASAATPNRSSTARFAAALPGEVRAHRMALGCTGSRAGSH